jgi:hypothetical protein
MLSARKIVSFGAVLAVVASGIAFAEMTPGDHPMGSEHTQQMMESGQHSMGPGQMQHQRQRMMPMGAHGGMHEASTAPTLPGQDAFGAIQEVVRILESDPKTDWSKVDLEALRQHLIDMNEVTLKGRGRTKADRRRFENHGHRQRAHAHRDPEDDPSLRPDGERP